MADCVAWRIEDVEGAVTEEVVCAKVADLERDWFGEGYFSEFAASYRRASAAGLAQADLDDLLEITFPDWRILLARISRHKCFLEARAHHDFRRRRKRRRIS